MARRRQTFSSLCLLWFSCALVKQIFDRMWHKDWGWGTNAQHLENKHTTSQWSVPLESMCTVKNRTKEQTQAQVTDQLHVAVRMLCSFVVFQAV